MLSVAVAKSARHAEWAAMERRLSEQPPPTTALAYVGMPLFDMQLTQFSALEFKTYKNNQQTDQNKREKQENSSGVYTHAAPF